MRLVLATAAAASCLAAAPAVAQTTEPTGTTEPTQFTGPTGTTGPPPAVGPTLPSSALLAREVAPGGQIGLRVGASALTVGVQRRSGDGWLRVETLRPAAAPRTVVLRAPLRGTRLAVRLVTTQLRGVERRARIRVVTLASVGDVNLGDRPGQQIERFGPQWPWVSAGPVLRRADLAFANLECAISDRGSPWPKQYTFRGRPSSLRAAATVGGLDVVNLANNHSVDFGRLALLDTLRAARAVGIATVGAGATARSAYRPLVVERLGLRVAFVAFGTILPFEFQAGPRTPGTAWASPARIRAGVRAARRQADVVVATFHWGTERNAVEDPAQRALAGVALTAGASAVIGAHPHVLQPVRRVGARKVVAYSLGNFVFGAGSPGTTRSTILTLGLAADGVRSVSARRATIRGGRPIL